MGTCTWWLTENDPTDRCSYVPASSSRVEPTDSQPQHTYAAGNPCCFWPTLLYSIWVIVTMPASEGIMKHWTTNNGLKTFCFFSFFTKQYTYTHVRPHTHTQNTRNHTLLDTLTVSVEPMALPLLWLGVWFPAENDCAHSQYCKEFRIKKHPRNGIHVYVPPVCSSTHCTHRNVRIVKYLAGSILQINPLLHCSPEFTRLEFDFFFHLRLALTKWSYNGLLVNMLL